jgi:capsular polysaccharide biosynthesis protein
MEANQVELKQYLKIIRKRFLLIAAIVIIACVLTGIKSFMFTSPVYSASAKLIVNKSIQVDGQKQMDLGSVETNIMLINSYIEIINSSAILDKVAEKYPDIKASPDHIGSMLSVSSAKGSQVMDLTATDTSYEEAAKVVNAVATVFKNEIPSIMNVNNVTILSEAKLDAQPGPINGNPIINILLSFIVSLMLAIGLVFLLDYLDDSTKTEQDVEQMLDLPVLAQIAKLNKTELQPGRSRVSDKQVGEGTYVSAK